MAGRSRRSAGSGGDGGADTIIIKKYANRRLYDTRSSRYVTLDDLAQMVRDGDEFTVVDAKTGEDLTRSVLTQIIFEAEAKGANMLPTGFLRSVIKFYGDSLQSLLPTYLDHTMAAFSRNQNELRRQIEEMGSMFGLAQWEEISRRNLAFFQRAAEMFSPFGTGFAGGDGTAPPRREPSAEAGEGDSKEQQLDALKAQLDALQARLDTLTQDRGDS